jgi:hypothetical protein
MEGDNMATEAKKPKVFYCGPGLRSFLDMCKQHQNLPVQAEDSAKVDGDWYTSLLKKHFAGAGSAHIVALIGLFVTPRYSRSNDARVLAVIVERLKRHGLDPDYEIDARILVELDAHLQKVPGFKVGAAPARRGRPKKLKCEPGLVPFLELCGEQRELIVAESGGNSALRTWFHRLLQRHFQGDSSVTIDDLLGLLLAANFAHEDDGMLLDVMLNRLKAAGLDKNYRLPRDAGSQVSGLLREQRDELEAAS